MIALRATLVVLALALAACSTVVPAAAGDDGIVRLRPGQAATFAGGGRLRYEALVNDSRCAPDVQCIWAGDAEVAFTWQTESREREAFSLHTAVGAKSHALGTRTLTLVGLGRGEAPEATVRLDGD